jgi:hypothetical protein
MGDPVRKNLTDYIRSKFTTYIIVVEELGEASTI